MALMFTPPTAPLRPMTGSRYVDHPAHSLFRHFRPHEAGMNVWLMPGGVVTTNDPGDGSEVRVFHGGHQHPVDDAETALLRAAGYTVVSLVAATSGFGNDFGNDFGGPA